MLFAYGASLQELTKESPFYLLYGCDPRLPTIHGLDSAQHHIADLDAYKEKVALNFLKPGNWQGAILKGHNSAKRRNMTAVA